jgi:hypothetical protein
MAETRRVAKGRSNDAIWRPNGLPLIARSECRTGRCRNRNPPAASLSSHEPNGYPNSAGFDDSFFALGVPVDALADCR